MPNDAPVPGNGDEICGTYVIDMGLDNGVRYAELFIFIDPGLGRAM